jgi:hypothetical protein
MKTLHKFEEYVTPAVRAIDCVIEAGFAVSESGFDDLDFDGRENE